MTKNTDKLITAEIKARKVTYYLTTEDDLQNIKSNSLLGDLFSILASLTAGGIISVILTRATGIQLAQQTTDVLDVLLIVFICATVIFACFCAYFYYQSFITIKRIKGSGEIKSLKSENQVVIAETGIAHEAIAVGKTRFEIINAVYWTSNAKIDVTEELRRRIVDNKLDEIVSNEIKGDPDVGTKKKLTIKYSFDGIIVMKEFTEGERIILP